MRGKSALILAAVFGVTFGIAISAAGQTVWTTRAGSSWIGIGTRDVTADDVTRDRLPGEFGASVTDVSDGPAGRAGIRTGDVIVEFDGVRVRSTAELQRLVRETPPGRTVKVGLVRAGKRMDVTLKTEANPNARDFNFEIPMPEFREGPLQPPQRYRLYPEPPSNRNRPPSAGGGWMFPGPIPLPSNTPRLGISLDELTPQLAEYFHTKEGVLVSSVDDGSPASRAGVKAGDIITSIDGHSVAHADDVRGVIRDKRSGDEVTLGIVREGKPLTIKATLAGERRGSESYF